MADEGDQCRAEDAPAGIEVTSVAYARVVRRGIVGIGHPVAVAVVERPEPVLCRRRVRRAVERLARGL